MHKLIWYSVQLYHRLTGETGVD